jgi:hypothetical protein
MQRTPAMTGGLTGHIWTLKELMNFGACSIRYVHDPRATIRLNLFSEMNSGNI